MAEPTLESLAAQLAALDARMTDLENQVYEFIRTAREADDTASWLIERTDQIGEDKIDRSKVAGEFRRLAPPKVESIRKNGIVRKRIAR